MGKTVAMGAERNSFLRDSSYSFMAKASMAVARGLGILTISRALGPENYGQYAIVLNTYAVMVLFGGLGLEQANTYYVGRHPQACGVLLGNACLSSLGLGLVTVALFLGVVHLCSGWLFEPSAIRLMTESMFFVPAAILHQQLAGLVVGLSRFRYYALADVGKWSVYLGSVLLLSATGHLDSRSALYAFMIVIGLTSGAHALVLQHEAQRRGKVELARRHLALRTLDYGWRAFLVNVVNLLNFRFDLYLVKYYRSLSEVGNYSLGTNMAEILLYFARSVSVVLFSRVSSDHERSKALTPVIARHSLVLVLGVTAIILLVKDNLILAFLGSAYAYCANVVTLSLPGIVAQTLTLVLMADLLGRGSLRAVFSSAVISFTAMAVLDLLWIPRFGIYGAAVASTLAYAAQCVFLLHHHVRSTQNPLGHYLFMPRKEVTELMARARRQAVA